MPRTLGISPKVFVPSLLQLIGILVNWIASGEFDRTELAQVVGLALTAVVGYLVPPGDVAGVNYGPPSDDALSPDVERKLRAQSGYGLIEALLAMFLVLVILVVLIRLL